MSNPLRNPQGSLGSWGNLLGLQQKENRSRKGPCGWGSFVIKSLFQHDITSRTPLYTQTDEFFWQISFTRGELVRWSYNKSSKDERPSRSWWCIPCPHGESCQLQKHPEMHVSTNVDILGIGHLTFKTFSSCPATCGPALQPILWSARLSREQIVANCWRPQQFFLWNPVPLCPFIYKQYEKQAPVSWPSYPTKCAFSNFIMLIEIPMSLKHRTYSSSLPSTSSPFSDFAHVVIVDVRILVAILQRKSCGTKHRNPTEETNLQTVEVPNFKDCKSTKPLKRLVWSLNMNFSNL